MPRDDTPRLIYSPRAWLKAQFLCHAGPTEIGVFALTAENEPLYVEDLLVPAQETTAASVAFDDAAVADLFDAMADAGIPASRFARIWLHTHPGASVIPSGVDEATFARVFGRNDWAVMAILGRTGRTYARLRFAAGPGGSLEIASIVDWAAWPALAETASWPQTVTQWRQEYERNVRPMHARLAIDHADMKSSPSAGFDPWLFPDDPFLKDTLHELWQ